MVQGQRSPGSRYYMTLVRCELALAHCKIPNGTKLPIFVFLINVEWFFFSGFPAHIKLLGVRARVPLTSKALLCMTDFNKQPVAQHLFQVCQVSFNTF